MLAIRDKGVYKLVDASQLELATRTGWRLVAVLDQQSPMSYCDMENIATVPTYSGGPTTMMVSNTRYHDMKTQMFLVIQDEESIIAGLASEVGSLQENLKNLKEAEKKNAEVRDAAIKALSEAEAANKTLIDQNQKLAEKEAIAHDALEKYRAEVAEQVRIAKDMAATATAVLEENAQRRKTAYERVAEGEYDDGIESVEERDVG